MAYKTLGADSFFYYHHVKTFMKMLDRPKCEGFMVLREMCSLSQVLMIYKVFIVQENFFFFCSFSTFFVSKGVAQLHKTVP